MDVQGNVRDATRERPLSRLLTSRIASIGVKVKPEASSPRIGDKNVASGRILPRKFGALQAIGRAHE
eukprot:CAMPEP_0206058894 /NCGR_PEP_ID=MMETSP1466-20131121/47722_1 /ASSEMBLY_ACC=CAM_ASM_001126 /TAXON_ID=44452 /ORGANISM="Pavlova gyrans, Strain CCMP608" /LENGTH=66 /DNA_ID=CAMNT_0053434205 /DNA_START=296 /DNA_END=493 /DNA_ORIENTATION=+